jgi:hypothetical protein
MSELFTTEKYSLLGGLKPSQRTEPQSNDMDRASIELNGTNEYLANTTAQSLEIGNSWTIAGWYKTDVAPTGEYLFEIWNGSNNNDRVRVYINNDSGGRYQVANFSSTGGLLGNPAYPFPAGTNRWFHIALTWDGTALKLYHNGVVRPVQAGSTGAGTMADSNRRIYVGYGAQSPDPGNYWDGHVHSFAIWDKDLTQNEVRALFNHGSPSSMDLNRNRGDYTAAYDLKHWWRLSFDVSDIGKDYGNASNLIDIDANAVGVTKADIVAEAPDGAYIDFDGSNEYIGNFNPGSIGISNSFTHSVWVNFTALNPGNYLSVTDIQDKSTNNKNQMTISFENTSPNRLKCFISDASINWAQAIATGTDIQTGTWYHIVAVKDGTTALRLYINGKEVASDTTSVPDTSASDDGNREIVLGANGNGSGAPNLHTNCKIHSAALWDRALTADEIKGMYNGGHKDIDLSRRARDYAGGGDLVHWWRLGQPTGSVGTGGNQTVDQVESGGINIQANTNAFTEADIFPASSVAKGVSVDLDGSTEYFQSNFISSIGIANSWSVMAAFKFDSLTGLQTITTISDVITAPYGNNSILMFKRSPGNNDITINLVDSSGTIFKNYKFFTASAGVWYHIVFTWDGTNLKLYRNGQEVTPTLKSTDLAGTMTDTSRFVTMGRQDPYRFNGKYCQEAVWSSALSADEIAQLYSRRNSIDLRKDTEAYTSASNLVHYWKLGEDPDDIGKDYVDSNQIDVDTNAANITTADIVGDAP